MHRLLHATLAALPCALTLGLAALPAPAQAAEVTRLASSFDDEDPFDLHLKVGFEHTAQRTKLVREVQGAADGATERPELWYRAGDSRLNLGLAVGLYRDLEFSFRLPLVIAANESWEYVAGNSEATSSIPRNCVQTNGELLDPGCPSTGAGARPLFGVPNNTYRGGLGNVHFGLAYALFNQDRDPTKPTWVLGLDYEAPTAERLEPAVPTSDESSGSVGDRVHKYTVYTAFSRRVGVAEPYFRAHLTLPYRGPGWYSNCDAPDVALLGRPDNCGRGPWSRDETGIRSPTQLGALVGAELLAFSDPKEQQRFAIDVRGSAAYTSSGRYYNELSGLTGRLMSSQGYGQFGGTLGASAMAADFFHLRAGLTLLYNTNRLLTDESLGQDVDGDGQVEVEPGSVEANPSFDHRVDVPGRRFIAERDTVLRFDFTAAFTF